MPNRFLRTILRVGGSIRPDGQTAQAAPAHILAWAPQRIILSHGKGYDRDIAATPGRAFRWTT